ncbi:MAG: FtsX-like permease family protein [Pseudomonadota bacterium]
MNSARLALRLLRRDWRAGELRLLATAILVAVASVTAVAFLTDRIEGAMERQAGEVLAADLSLEWSEPLPDSLEAAARERGLRSARTLEFPSVVLGGDLTQLVQVKAVSLGYPLRGELRIAPAPGEADIQPRGAPAAGEAWVEPRLLALLDLQPGDPLQLGTLELRVSHLLTHEPDRAANLFRLSPRVMIGDTEIQDSGLLGPASRVRHRLLVAGDAAAVADYRAWLKTRLPDGASIDDVRNARPELRAALERGGRFLRLSAATALLLCAVAVALATRRFVERQADTGALMRCLGASRRQVTLVFALRLLGLGLVASLAGALAGLAAQEVLTALVGDWFTSDPPPPSPLPFVTGVVTGTLVLAGFSLPSVVRLGRVSPLRVLRRDLGIPSAGTWVAITATAASLAALFLWQIGDDALALRLILGLAAAVAVMLLTARLLVLGLRPLRRRAAGSWRYGLASLARNPAATSFQLTGFGLGLTALLLLAMVRLDLLGSWQASLPPGTPNQFLINIQPDEVPGVRSLLQGHGVDDAELYPMARGRLTAIGERRVQPEDYPNPRARRLAAREFNLSWATQMQEDNRIVAGRWWKEDEQDQAWLSVEEGIAETLGIALDDRLEFDVAGQRFDAKVTSLRSVEWDSFNANFFVMGTPGLMADLPATYITSFHLPPGRDEVIRDLVREFPSVTALDVSALIRQVRTIMDRGALAVETVFLFTLLAGVVVLHAGIQATRDLRVQEAAVLRTLGLTRRRMLLAMALEFGILGALSGLVAAGVSSAVGYSLAVTVFDLPWRFNPGLWVIAVAGGAVGVGLAGTLATWRLVSRPPLVVLREA